MPSQNIIDFQAARLRALHKTASQPHNERYLELPDISYHEDATAGSDDAALIIRVVLQFSRQRGRDYHGLPRVARMALDDLCA